MRSLHDRLKAAEQSAAQKVRQMPGLRQVDALFGGITASREVTVDQEVLGNSIGRVAIIGDFGYTGSSRLRKDIAQRAVKMLQRSGVVAAEVPVDIQTMIPEVADVDNDPCVERSARALFMAFDQAGYSATTHKDPLKVAIGGRDGIVNTLNTYASISEAITNSEGKEKSLLVVANPFFVSQVLPNINYGNINAGGVAMLAEVGSRPEKNRFIQLWPVAPSV